MNDWLFYAGDPSDAIYVVGSGRFAAVGPDGRVIREMTSGDSVGDVGVISGEPRSAGVRVLRDGFVWRIAADAFTEVLVTTPKLQTSMLRVMAKMLRESKSANIDGRPRVIGVLSTGRATAAPVVDALTRRLATHGRTAVLAPSVESTADFGGYGDLVGAFSETLDSAERTNDWVLVVADRGSSDFWRRYVIAQSDRLLVVVNQRLPPQRLDLHEHRGPIHLVTCAVEPDPAWWDLVDPVSRHAADDNGMAALARRIAGRSLGLVLAGGGARGLAHFGVYQELTRAGVVIDRFGGTSAGAIAAAAFATGMAADSAIVAARKLMVEGAPLGDYAVPAVAFIRGGRVDRLVNEFYGTVLIEHLPREFFSVSADMITGDQILHRRGRLSLAVRASMSIPGLMPPVHSGSQILVDGGLLNNLPADVMSADSDGDTIAVDLRTTYVPSTGFPLLPRIVQPPGFVRRVLTGTDVALPPLQETLFRTVDLAASSGNLRDLPRIAVVIEPDVSAVGLLDFKRIDAALEAGRIAARAALEATPSLVG